jgi:hypothetical protein
LSRSTLGGTFARIVWGVEMDRDIEDGQVYALNSLIGKVATHRDMRLWIVGKLIGREIESTKDMTVSEWQQVRDEAYPNWVDDDWEACDDFMDKLNSLKREYERDVMGQQGLFD